MAYKKQNEAFLSEFIKKCGLLIVTATKVEKETLHHYLKPTNGETDIIIVNKDTQTYYLGTFGIYNAVHVACGDMGSLGRESSSRTVGEAVTVCLPKVVLMVGIAFGKSQKEQKIGDVLVSERVLNYEPQKLKKGKVENRGKDGPASLVLVNRFRNQPDWEYKISGNIRYNKSSPKHNLEGTPEVFVGPILSGEKLLDDPAIKQVLLTSYSTAIGGEMEGAGIYNSCDGRVDHWILVKGICDFADGRKGVKKNERQAAAADSAVNLCLHVFSSENDIKSTGLIPFSNIQIETSLLELLKIQVTRQLKKQVNSEKYIPDTFVEIGSTKDCLRYLCDPILYANKFYDEISRLDFRLLNNYLKEKDLSEFEFNTNHLKASLNRLTVQDAHQTLKNWLKFLNEKSTELSKIKISSNTLYHFKNKFIDPNNYIKALYSRVALITETAGQGKTNFLCDFCDLFLIQRGIPTVFLTGTDLIADNIRETILRKVYPDRPQNSQNYQSFLEEIRKYCSENNKFFVIIIDGINEQENLKALKKELEDFIETSLAHPYVRIIISCRTEYFSDNFSNLTKSSFSDEIFRSESLRVPQNDDSIKEKLFDTYLSFFEVKLNNYSKGAFNQLVSNFLLLRIFCEVYKGQRLSSLQNIYKQELFKEYYNKKRLEINERTVSKGFAGADFDINQFVLKIAQLMIEHKTYVNISLDEILADTRYSEVFYRFLDENILLRKDLNNAGTSLIPASEVVNFTFDEFRDYILSAYLIDQLYISDINAFKEFIANELSQKSPIREGCSRYLYFSARDKKDQVLMDLIKAQEWFDEIEWDCILNLPDHKIEEKDRKRIKEILLSSRFERYTIIRSLIFRFHSSYTNLGSDFLWSFLRGLDETQFKNIFIDAFHTSVRGYGKIDQEKLLESIDNILDKNLMQENPELHRVFELLPYMLINPDSFEVERILGKYIGRYEDQAKVYLMNAQKSSNAILVKKIELFIKNYETSI